MKNLHTRGHRSRWAHTKALVTDRRYGKAQLHRVTDKFWDFLVLACIFGAILILIGGR